MPVDRPSEEAVARGTSATPVDDDHDDAEKDSSGVIMCTSHPPNLAAAESLPRSSGDYFPGSHRRNWIKRV